jgi:hypothetical protein
VCIYVADLVAWDVPYGILEEAWDVAMTDPEWTQFVKFANYCMSDKSFGLVILTLHISQWNVAHAALLAGGFKKTTTIYMYKSGQNQKGTNRFINAVEVILIGFKEALAHGGPNGRSWAESPNPLKRHNFLVTDVNRNKLQHHDGSVVNSCEKHPGVYQFLAKLLLAPGSSVLECGPGGGGCMLGWLGAGMHVVGIEQDPVQVTPLRGALTKLESADVIDFPNPPTFHELKEEIAELKKERDDLQAENDELRAAAKVKVLDATAIVVGNEQEAVEVVAQIGIDLDMDV